METNLPAGLAVFPLPEPHRRRLRTKSALERLNRELRRRTRVAALFSNEALFLRLVSAMAAEIGEAQRTARPDARVPGARLRSPGTLGRLRRGTRRGGRHRGVPPARSFAQAGDSVGALASFLEAERAAGDSTPLPPAHHRRPARGPRSHRHAARARESREPALNESRACPFDASAPVWEPANPRGPLRTEARESYCLPYDFPVTVTWIPPQRESTGLPPR